MKLFRKKKKNVSKEKIEKNRMYHITKILLQKDLIKMKNLISNSNSKVIVLVDDEEVVLNKKILLLVIYYYLLNFYKK